MYGITNRKPLNELKEEMLKNVAGGDRKHYEELCEQAAAFASECIENNLNAAFYQAEMKKVMDQYIDLGMLEGNEPDELWRIVEYYSHRLRKTQMA